MSDNLSWTSEPESFSQRFGYDPLPESMKLEYLSEKARTAVFNILYDLVSASGNWSWNVNHPRPKNVSSCNSFVLGEKYA